MVFVAVFDVVRIPLSTLFPSALRAVADGVAVTSLCAIGKSVGVGVVDVVIFEAGSGVALVLEIESDVDVLGTTAGAFVTLEEVDESWLLLATELLAAELLAIDSAALVLVVVDDAASLEPVKGTFGEFWICGLEAVVCTAVCVVDCAVVLVVDCAAARDEASAARDPVSDVAVLGTAVQRSPSIEVI